ncbi:MAG: LpxD N-terminal domain-containing protein, partial [Phycisphaerae bacterium]
MKKALGELARLVGGRLEGDAGREVEGVASLAEAGPRDVAFVAQKRCKSAAANAKAGCLVVPDDWEGKVGGAALLRVADPNRAMARIAEMLLAPLPVLPTGVHPSAAVAKSAVLGKDVHVGPCAVVGEKARVGDRTRIRAGAVVADEAAIGADCDIHSAVVVRERVRLGDRVIIHAGSVIGSDGFGYLAGKT